jgi:hypothetical protein
VTNYLDPAFADRDCSLLPSLGAAPVARVTATPLKGIPSASTAAGTGVKSGYEAHNRFAMAGIKVNVWPMSPKDWSSG